MFGFLTSVANEATDPLTDMVTVESFWRTLPRDDPFAAQKAVCAALAEPIARGSLNTDRLRALLLLDQRARPLMDVLLVDDFAECAQAVSQETHPWQAAFELCGSFGRAHGQFLRSLRDNPGFEGWRKYESQLLLRLFNHRQNELFLRPFVDERSTRFSWKELHAAYRFAQLRGLLHDPLPINRNGSPSAADTTLEREYIHALMQDFVNGGQFPPHDAFWINQGIPRWCHETALESHEVRSGELRFIVDPHGDAGLARSGRESAGTHLCLGMASVLGSMRDEAASLRDAPGSPSDGAALGRARKLAVLSKLNVHCAPERPLIPRRGEREPTASAVEVVVGVWQILRALRKRPGDVIATTPRTAAKSEGMTITGFGGTGEDSTGVYPNGARTVAEGSTGATKVASALMTMADHSDSGCRLHGPALASSPTLPGALIAFRQDAGSPWTLAVVRRVKKRLAGKRVEIGAEYLGKDPRWVVVVVPDSDTKPGKTPDSKPPRFAALYLPESTRHPVLPMKTLILPSRFSPGCQLSVRSRTSVHTIQLKEPLEEQADFLWSPFEILERWLKDEPTSSEPTSA